MFKKKKKANLEGEKPVILQVLPALDQGGVERSVLDLSLYIKEAGWEVVVVSSGGALVRILERNGIKHITLPIHKKGFFAINKSARMIAKVIKNHNVNVVHGHSRAPAWAAYKAANMTKVPFVTTFHGRYGLGLFGIKKSYNKIMTMGDAVIANSDFIKKHILKNYKISKDKIKTIPMWADLNKFDPTKVSTERIVKLATKWRIPEDASIITQVGRLSWLKGHRVLIEALSLIKGKKIRCLIVGPDQGRKNYVKGLQKVIDKYNLNDVVHITGSEDDVPAVLMVTDVAVSASVLPESFGMSALEAEAMGRPIVATAHGGHLETIIDNKTGKLITPNDPKELADGIEWALNLTDKQRDDLSKDAMSHVRDNFSRDVQCRKILEVYASFFN